MKGGTSLRADAKSSRPAFLVLSMDIDPFRAVGLGWDAAAPLLPYSAASLSARLI
jgi:hypothetical protein